MERYETLYCWSSHGPSFVKNNWVVAIVPSYKVDIEKLSQRFPKAKIGRWKENPDMLYIEPGKGGEPHSLIQILDWLGEEGWESYETDSFGKHSLRRHIISADVKE